MANEVEMPAAVPNEAQEDQAAREGEKFFIASQWNLMWWKFKKHKVAVFCSFVILFLGGGPVRLDSPRGSVECIPLVVNLPLPLSNRWR